MNSIVTEIANIIKSEDNYIKRERKIICFFLNLIKEIMALALAKVDDEMITKVKAQ
ncbi:ISLre2 family transposase, partial [Lactobacillus crispatus]